MEWSDGKKRCCWANPKNERYIRYHDEEWGVPVHDDGKLFEMLVLECFQAGLSWECVLNKREAFRAAFDGFDLEAVCAYGEDKLEALRNDPGIIRNRLKIQAAVTFEGLSELVSKRKPEIVFNQAKKGESQLKINLLTFITNYGALIFQEEAKNDARILAQILVDSRNRIAHIKSRQGRVYLDGAESVIYLKKMSLMYRIVLIDLLEIDESVYLTRLSSQVKLINEHDTMKKFLQKLGGESDGSV